MEDRMSTNFCAQCGNHLDVGSQFCMKCGAKVDSGSYNTSQVSTSSSAKSAGLTFFLCLFFGMLGLHRFYVGKIGTGILMLITGGGFGIWALIDLIFIVNNKFDDKHGNLLLLTQNPSGLKKSAMVVGSIIAWFFVFVAILMAIVFYATSGLVGTVNGQLIALRDGDISKAYTYTSKDFQKATSLDDFKKFLDHYPSLKNNASASFSERKIEDNNIGSVKGTLTSKDGAKTPIEYQLIKEGDSWKILGITVLPTGAGIEINHGSDNSSNASSANVYDDKNNKFSIKYPASWGYEKPEKGTIIFSGPKGTPSFYSTVNIQTILSKKAGGRYSTVEAFMGAIKKQIEEGSSHSKILSEGKVELPQNPKRFHGEYIVFTYSYKGQAFKQMQFVIARDDGSAFYAWAYTSPAEAYEADLPVAKAMYESWEIN